jgi:hypothetical protein
MRRRRLLKGRLALLTGRSRSCPVCFRFYALQKIVLSTLGALNDVMLPLEDAVARCQLPDAFDIQPGNQLLDLLIDNSA